MALGPCVDAFITALLCSNPILKGAFVTTLSGLVIQLDLLVAQSTLQLGRFNILNKVLEFQIQLLQAVIGKVSADLNLILGPLRAFGTCPELARLNEALQNTAVGKVFSSLQKKLYEANRLTNLTIVQDGITKKRQQLRKDALDIIERINILCP